MIVWPWIAGRGDWAHVQAVWDRWQSLNVGILAFASSVVALKIAKYNAENQRERNFFAAKAFLPAALSELTSYFKGSAKFYKSCWASDFGIPPNFVLPDLPKEYKKVFADCIRYANPLIGDYLSRILVKLQIHDARMRNYVDQHTNGDYLNLDKYNLITYFYKIGELHALIGKLFGFARNMNEFDSSPLNWEDFRNAYANLDIELDEIVMNHDNLEAFTMRKVDRDKSKMIFSSN